MNILYFTWDEVTRKDMEETLTRAGHNVGVVAYDIKNYLVDAKLDALLDGKLAEGSWDCMISTNFVPVLSKVAFRRKCPYISWIYDSPSLTLYSEMVFSPYNYIFHFDNSQVEEFRQKGVKNIWHMPLAVNLERVDARIRAAVQRGINHKFSDIDVSFMGNLYSENLKFPDNIAGLGEYEKGYVKALINSQLRIWGYDLIGESCSDAVVEAFLKHMDINLEPELIITDKDILLNMIRKNASGTERFELLDMLAEHFKVTLFSHSDSSRLTNVENRGYIDYNSEMPVMFNQSKINLNITIRTIQSGISLRAMDIMGAGGFLLSNWQPELNELFEDGKELVMYYDRQDLIDKVSYYLGHEEERQQIARNGRTKIASEYTYEKAWEKIFKLSGLA